MRNATIAIRADREAEARNTASSPISNKGRSQRGIYRPLRMNLNAYTATIAAKTIPATVKLSVDRSARAEVTFAGTAAIAEPIVATTPEARTIFFIVENFLL